MARMTIVSDEMRDEIHQRRIEVGNADQILVPELLPDKTPPLGNLEPKKCLVFRYQYPVLSHGVLLRFITRTHHLSAGLERWRTGVVVADDGAEGLLDASKYVKDFTGNIAGTLGTLGKLVLGGD